MLVETSGSWFLKTALTKADAAGAKRLAASVASGKDTAIVGARNNHVASVSLALTLAQRS